MFSNNKFKLTLGVSLLALSAISLQGCSSSGSSSNTATPSGIIIPDVNRTPNISGDKSVTINGVTTSLSNQGLEDGSEIATVAASGNVATTEETLEEAFKTKTFNSSVALTVEGSADGKSFSLKDSPAYSFAESGDDLIVKIAGTSYTFKETAGSNGDTSLVYTAPDGNTIRFENFDIANGHTYLGAASIFSEKGLILGSGNSETALFVTGLESDATKFEDLDLVNGKATYSGKADLSFFSAHIDGGNNDSYDTTFDVDFTNSKIKGEIAFDDGASVKMSETDISGNAYAGNFEATTIHPSDDDSETITISNTSTYTGKFFGPNAEETAGAIGVNGTHTYKGTEANLTGGGVFAAKR